MMSRKRTRGSGEAVVKSEESEASSPPRQLRQRAAKAEAADEVEDGSTAEDIASSAAKRASAREIEVTPDNYMLTKDLESEEPDGNDQKTKKKKYTGQTTEERLKLRAQYRTLYEQFLDNTDLLQDSAVFSRLLRNQNKLLKQVTTTGEALYDAKILGEVTELGLKFTETAARANYGTVSDYIRKLSERAARLENPGNIWAELGSVTGRYFRGVPPTNFMLGTFHVEQKAPRARQPREAKESAGQEKRPEQVESTEQDEKTATDARVQDLHARLAELRAPMNLFSFLLNPESYTQSIENLFDFSFLLKHQRAEIMIRDGVPFVSPHDEPTEADWASGVTPISIVTKMDFSMYQEALRLYNIRKSHLPTRKVQS